MRKNKSLNDFLDKDDVKSLKEPMDKKKIFILIGLFIAVVIVIIAIFVVKAQKDLQIQAQQEHQKRSELTFRNVSSVAIPNENIGKYIEAKNQYSWLPSYRYDLSDEEQTKDGIEDENIIDIFKTTTNKVAYVHYHHATILEVKMFDTIEEAKKTVRTLMYAKVKSENEKILKKAESQKINRSNAPETDALVQSFKPGMTQKEFKEERDKYNNVVSAANFKVGVANTGFAVIAKEGFVLIITSPDGIYRVKPLSKLDEALSYIAENYIISLDEIRNESFD